MRVLSLIPAAVLLLATGVLGDASSATGVSTTLATSTTSSAVSMATSAMSTASSFPDPDINPETRCLAKDIVKFPFCSPGMDAVWRTDGNYYVTWDSHQWLVNSTVFLTLNYRSYGGAGPGIESWDIPNAKGFLLISPKEEWLYNQTLKDTGISNKVDYQEVYFQISNSEPSTDGARGQYSSPTLKFTSKVIAAPVDTSPRNRPAVSPFGLAIGLPLVFGLILATVCGTHFCMRNRRQIGPIAIGGGRKHFHKKGYTGREARRQRAHVGGGAAYTDEPEADMIAEEGRSAAAQRDWELASVRGGRNGAH